MSDTKFDRAKLVRLIHDPDLLRAEVAKARRDGWRPDTSPPELNERIKAKLRAQIELDALKQQESAGTSAATMPETNLVPMRPKARRIREANVGSSTPLPWAAATGETQKEPELRKYDEWYVGLGDIVCQFYSDGAHIYIGGIPANAATEVRLQGKAHKLEWVEELQLYRAPTLSSRELKEMIETLDNDETAFDIK